MLIKYRSCGGSMADMVEEKVSSVEFFQGSLLDPDKIYVGCTRANEADRKRWGDFFEIYRLDHIECIKDDGQCLND